jgi:heat shock protein HtpX
VSSSRAVALLIGPPAVLAGLIAAAISLLLLPWYDAPALFLVVATLVAVYLWQRATPYTLAKLGARPLRRNEYPRVENLADGLSAATGMPAPQLLVIDSPAANAVVLGKSEHDSVIGLTTGLLDRVDVVGLEGVLAHLFTRWRSDRPRIDTLFAHVAGTVYAPFPGVAARLGAAVLTPARDLEADLAAVNVTRYPPGLDRALDTVSHQGAEVEVPRALAHLWLVPPAEPLAPVSFTLDERIAVLREL